ncbi:hypothetical protein DTO013E5_1709 [Penicillium roqueforti]|uniref:Hypervirulence associated protein TUDOR domain-containing protein n=1 Tax=Penicillium roqueforti (strain FM164) TaxID=1365484 RepID=W6QBA5_PENRF|nr:uncharacterized protein LCP9604111_2682 [Penicillium roqueforti]XP_057041870.1 uncharacterized protein N7518_004173 [Penicillium psychrosexuale]CDM33978.1 Protein of unknown function DUF2945 [Penicillium roqueforti FM164]KAF9251281.1 hypothetical protein LCP9604111_2682 [Penicillium roqueforti]KAI1837859.1 hypothetical protein CBS147337_1082 [Penicillium roqueforti]KAI2678549.1 hypothetical protein CBS147355_4434 [Penicillium roqueforti]KAI2689352.1 hypothetical protein LCP963914a_2441 [Pe
MPHFKEGDKVNYKPVGGPQSRTSMSVGLVREILGGRSSSDEETRYTIENLHTHKTSSIKERNIEGPAE